MSQSNIELMRGAYEAFAKGDVPAVLGLMTPDIVWSEPDVPGHPLRGTHNGPNAVLQEVFMAIGGTFDEFQVMPEEFFASGDKVVAIGTIRGKVKASGKSFEYPFAHVATFQDGKWSRFLAIEDAALMLAALG